MSGRVLYEDVLTSKRFNDLWEIDGSGFAHNLYFCTYILCDNWGHLPFDPQWIGIKTRPGAASDSGRVLRGMCALLACRLWDFYYQVGGKYFVHIYKFEEKSLQAIRFRRKGFWPDESGEIPVMGKNEDIKESIKKDAAVRKTATESDYKTEFADIFFSFGSGGVKHKRTAVPHDDKPPQAPPPEKKPEHPVKSAIPKKINGKPNAVILPASESPEMQKLVRLSFFKRLVVRAGDEREAALYIYRAISAGANDLYAWITAGLKKNDGYVTRPCKDEYDNKEKVERWLDKINGIIAKESAGTPEKGMATINEVLEMMRGAAAATPESETVRTGT
jgi:hypothetical protein